MPLNSPYNIIVSFCRVPAYSSKCGREVVRAYIQKFYRNGEYICVDGETPKGELISRGEYSTEDEANAIISDMKLIYEIYEILES